MAATGRRPDQPLSRQLREAPAQFDWYQLIRLLLMEQAGGDALDRSTRFRADLSLAFPANEITAVVDAEGTGASAVVSPNYVVAGYLGPLPDAFTEWLHERRAAGDRAMADFLDLFNHRIGCLRFRIKSRVSPALNLRAPEETPLAQRLSAVMGLAEPSLAAQLPIPKRALLGVAGLLANRRRSLDTIERVLACYLAAPVTVAPFDGAWRLIATSDQTLLARKNHRLGESAVLGARVWDQGAGVVVNIGPVSRVRLHELLPNGPRYPALAAMLRHLTDRQVDCRVRLSARAEDVPGTVLDSSTNSRAQLGLTSWLGDASAGVRVAAFVIPAYAAESADAA